MSKSVPHLASILRDFPSVRFAFAYGSGVFQQPGHRAGGKLLDFIFAVDNPRDWHTKNIEWNRNHYSCLATIGSRAVVWNADVVGTGVHFNTGAWWGSQRIKYGVLCAQRLCSDLKHWDTCYVSGRLQKPVQILQEDATILRANEQNLQSALAAGVLLLPPRFTTQELLSAVVGLSYTGDVRMGFAEDSRKVERIVSGSFPSLCNLYLPRLQGSAFEGLVSLDEEGLQGHKCMGQGSKARLVSMLPAALLRQMAVLGRRPGRRARLQPGQVEALPLEEVAALAATSRRVSRLLRRALRGIVRAASIRQAVAGLPMAGAWTSATYVWAKMQKAWHARKNV